MKSAMLNGSGCVDALTVHRDEMEARPLSYRHEPGLLSQFPEQLLRGYLG
jgi:hypothetical protein